MAGKNHQGFFITLEGIEGAGKSTHATFIANQLQKGDRDHVVTREPGGTRLGEQIRNILLHQNDFAINPYSETLLMFAARSQHIEEVIKPALIAGKVVICDRFTDSTYAYQGGGRCVEIADINKLVEVVHPALSPDLTLLFDLSPETGLDRAHAEKTADRFESEVIEFFRKARRVFLDRAKAEPQRFRVLDAEREITAIQEDIQKILQEKELC